MSKIEAELLKATGEEGEGKREGRQEFLDRIAEAAGKLPDAKWNKLTEEAQKWVNAANQAAIDKQDIEDFEDAGGEEEEAEQPRRGRGGDDDGDSRSSRGRGRDVEDEDDRGSRRGSRDDDGEEDDRRSSRGRGRDAEEDDDRGSRRGGDRDRDDDGDSRSSRRGRDSDGDDDRRSGGRERDSDDDRGSRRGRDAEDDRGSSRRTSREEPEERGSRRGGGKDDGDEGGDTEATPALKVKIKNIILDNPGATVDAIMKKLDTKVTISKNTVSGIRTEFRHSLKVIQDAKLLKKAIL